MGKKKKKELDTKLRIITIEPNNSLTTTNTNNKPFLFTNVLEENGTWYLLA